MSLSGKTILLFGAGAIANGYAPLFASQAGRVYLVSKGESCERLATSLKRMENRTADIFAIHADASDFDAIGRVYDQIGAEFGIDVVVNGVGGNKPEATVSKLENFIDMSPDVSMALMKENYFSKRFSLQHYARHLKRRGAQGSAVNITSMSGLNPLSKVIDYSTSYAAAESLTRSVAQLFGVHNFGRVNNLAVGFTIGEQNRRLLLNEDGSPTPRAKEILDATSQGRFLSTEEIAPHVLYLADSDISRPINGHTLRVDGGFNLVSLPGSGYTRNAS